MAAINLHDRTRVRHLTRRGVLWLGLRCDVRCKFCYDEHLPQRDKIWIAVDKAARTLDKFRYYYQNTAVDFMGGEPTLHPNVLDIVSHAARIGLRPTVITHGMRLAEMDRAEAYRRAGIYDFWVSIHGLGDTVSMIHRRGTGNFELQMRALDNLRALDIPFRFNVTMIRDNLTQLQAIAQLAGEKGARVVNFLTFNPYFEWTSDVEIEFQVRYSEAVPYLTKAIDKCLELSIEANVRYMPLCQLPGYEPHAYTGFQLPYDAHEWDYNSWYDSGHPGPPSAAWYRDASKRQQARHNYIHVAACGDCALHPICDGFHAQYVARWGGNEAVPHPGEIVTDPCHFIQRQQKIDCMQANGVCGDEVAYQHADALSLTQFRAVYDHRAGVRGSSMANGLE